jgi:hypothetical protein
MSVGVLVGLVLLPALMYALALLLAAARDRFGFRGLPRARALVRAARPVRWPPPGGPRPARRPF